MGPGEGLGAQDAVGGADHQRLGAAQPRSRIGQDRPSEGFGQGKDGGGFAAAGAGHDHPPPIRAEAARSNQGRHTAVRGRWPPRDDVVPRLPSGRP